MKKYERLKQIKLAEFKWLVGVKKETFEVMFEVYSEYEEEEKEKKNKEDLSSFARNATFFDVGIL